MLYSNSPNSCQNRSMTRLFQCKIPISKLLIAFLLLASGCAVVPETGRSQLLLVSPNEEFKLGITQFEKLKTENKISNDAQTRAILQRVGQRIASVVDLPNAKWEFVLFDDADTANAFCLPGGKVGVYTGILPITRDETGLATVIGHEVAHAVARHGAERISQGLVLQLGGEVLNAALQTRPSETNSLVMAAYGLGSQVGYMLPHSRNQELEADYLGLLYMARAGYDPRKSVDFWERFRAKSNGKTIEFLSTHPLDDTRIAQLKMHMPQAMAEYEKARGIKR